MLNPKYWVSHASGAAPEYDEAKVTEFLDSLDDAVMIIETKKSTTSDLYAKHIGFKFPVFKTKPIPKDLSPLEEMLYAAEEGEWVYE